MKKFNKKIDMKSKITVLLLTVCFFSSDMFSQMKITGPTHPLVNYGPVRIDTNIDTVLSLTYYESGREVVPGPKSTFSSYARSDDKLTDSITGSSGLMRHDIYQYNEKNQLLYRHEYDPLYPLMSYIKEEFTYDEKGRVIKLTVKVVKPSGIPTETILNEYLYDYSTVQMTENGYIFDGVEFELDNQGRLVYANYIDSKDEYIEYTDGKKYRIGADYYTYTDSSFTTFAFTQPGNMVLGMSDRWVEIIFVFDKNENLKRKTSTVSIDGVNWYPWEQYETEYIYSNVNTNPSNNSPVLKSNTVVYSHSNEIHVFTENEANVQIFDIFGRMIKQQNVSSGENRISISSGGIYIVKICNESFKVSIK